MDTKVDGAPAEAAVHSEGAGSKAEAMALLVKGMEGEQPKAEQIPAGEQKPAEVAKPEDKPVQVPEAAAVEPKPEGDKPENETEEIGAVTPEVQEKINRRIGKEVGKTKAAVERAEAAEAKANEAERRAAELESKSSAETLKAAEVLHVPPTMLTPDEAKTVERYEFLRQARRTLRDPKTWENGVVDEQTGAVKWTGEQVRAQFEAYDEELISIAGRAESIKQQKRAELQEVIRLGLEAKRKTTAANLSTQPRLSVAAPAAPRIAPQSPVPPAAVSVREPVSAGAPKRGFDEAKLVKDGATSESVKEQMRIAMGG